jgi:hypothetical protein
MDSSKYSTYIDKWDEAFMQVDKEMLFEILAVRFIYILLWVCAVC